MSTPGFLASQMRQHLAALLERAVRQAGQVDCLFSAASASWARRDHPSLEEARPTGKRNHSAAYNRILLRCSAACRAYYGQRLIQSGFPPAGRRPAFSGCRAPLEHRDTVNSFRAVRSRTSSTAVSGDAVEYKKSGCSGSGTPDSAPNPGGY